MARDFRYHLLSIGVNRDANGATVRSAERDAFGISWTFGQLGYWRADRNRCVTGAQATPSAIDAHLEMEAHLLVHLRLPPASANQRCERRGDLVIPSHVKLPQKRVGARG